MDRKRIPKEGGREKDLKMAFHLIIGQSIHFHEFPYLLWGGNCMQPMISNGHKISCKQ
jgi:hypothetical protein